MLTSQKMCFRVSWHFKFELIRKIAQPLSHTLVLIVLPISLWGLLDMFLYNLWLCVWFSRQLPMYNGDHRWQQLNPSPGGPYLAYPILSSPQAPVASDYPTYYHAIMPTPCPPVMGFYQPFPGPYPGPLQAGVLNPVSDSSQTQRGRGVSRNPVLQKVRDDSLKGQFTPKRKLAHVLLTLKAS